MAIVKQSIDVNAPLGSVYDQLTQFEQFPRFMTDIHSVHQRDDAHLHWYGNKGGQEMEWDAEITERIPNRCIAWRNTSGPRNSGSVTFEEIGPDKTRIHLVMDADDATLTPAELARDSHPAAETDLSRFKVMMESRQQEHAAESPSGSAQAHAGHRPATLTAGDTFASPQTGTFTANAENLRQTIRRSADRALQDNKFNAGDLSSPNAGSWMPNLMQAWGDRLTAMRNMAAEMDQVFERWAGMASARRNAWKAGAEQGAWLPDVELIRQPHELRILADLPGIKKEQITIEVEGRSLTIAGERQAPAHGSSDGDLRGERRYGPFSRVIALPAQVDRNAARASMQDGVLEILLPLAPEENRPRRVPVQTGGN